MEHETDELNTTLIELQKKLKRWFNDSSLKNFFLHHLSKYFLLTHINVTTDSNKIVVFRGN